MTILLLKEPEADTTEQPQREVRISIEEIHQTSTLNRARRSIIIAISPLAAQETEDVHDLLANELASVRFGETITAITSPTADDITDYRERVPSTDSIQGR